MRTHRTIFVSAATNDAAAFSAALKQLCRRMPLWRFMVRESKDYTTHADRPSYLIAFSGTSGLPPAAVALTSKGGKKRLRFYSPNIVPRESGQLSPEEYNELATRFVADLKKAPGYRTSGLSAKVTSGQVGLEEVIPGQECRKFFLNYLNGYPLTYHGSDIYNLDRFICAVNRFHAKISADDLARYLIKDRGWMELDAKWVRDRVRAGLEILAVHRRF